VLQERGRLDRIRRRPADRTSRPKPSRHFGEFPSTSQIVRVFPMIRG
jgi:hypothetical protein